MAASDAMVVHGLSVDVEGVDDAALMHGAHGPAPTPVAATESVLDLLAAHGVRATFFVLGTVAQRHGDLVQRIARAGHEVACHGLRHDMLPRLGEHAFRQQVSEARRLLQDLGGQSVDGFRAPTWSLGRAAPWAVEALLAAGFRYDSSIFPMATPLYGERGAPYRPYRLAVGNQRLIELPPAIRAMGPVRLPIGGGIYWRVLPVPVTLAMVGRAPSAEVYYMHPWEIDETFAPAGLGVLSHLAMTVGRRRLRPLLSALLQRERFRPLGEIAAEMAMQDLPVYALTSHGLGRAVRD